MNYTKYFEGLENASLFDLFRVKCAISKILKDPTKQLGIKRNLSVGMNVSYFDVDLNKLIDAVIITVKRAQVFVQNKHDGERWNVPFYMLNLEGVDTSIQPSTSSTKLDRNSLSVGDQVGFYSKLGVDLYGVILKLNPKYAKLKLHNGEIWTVSYSILFSVMEGEQQKHQGTGLLIEGSAVVKDKKAGDA